MNQQQWMSRFVEDIGALVSREQQARLKVILAFAWEQAHGYGYECGFNDGSDQEKNDLDAVLRDLWLVEDLDNEADRGYQQALESVAEHFGLGIDDEEESDD